MSGRNSWIYEWSPAVFHLGCLGQAGQVSEADLVQGVAVKCRVGPALVVERHMRSRPACASQTVSYACNASKPPTVYRPGQPQRIPSKSAQPLRAGVRRAFRHSYHGRRANGSLDTGTDPVITQGPGQKPEPALTSRGAMGVGQKLVHGWDLLASAQNHTCVAY